MQSQNNNKLKKVNKKEDTPLDGAPSRNFDDYDLNNIGMELERKKKEEADAEMDEDDEDDEDGDGDGDVDDGDDGAEAGEGGEVVKAKMGFDTIVIQPGSSTIRIGRATDAFPLTVPAVIAVKKKDAPKGEDQRGPYPYRTVDASGTHFTEDFDHFRDIVTKDFKARMKYYKRRILPNSRESASNYNKKQEPEKIADHNDPYKKEWLDLKEPENRSRPVFVGDEALKLEIKGDWMLRFPIKYGNFNETNYQSPHEVLGDLAYIVIDSLRKLEIQGKQQLGNLKALLVIPDLYDKIYVETWCDMLLKQIGFGKIAIIQESVAATFGAGTQSACVIDVGAQTTTIACVDEGLIINDSRISLNYGGDNITETFIKLLLELSFPYKDIDLKSFNDDWELAESLKKNYVTFQDADIAVQLYNFYKRKPGQLTEKFEFKVFDEVMISPLGLFYPGLFQNENEDVVESSKRLFPVSMDQYSGKPNNPYSKAQENITTNHIHADLTDDQLLLEIVDEKNRLKNANPYSKPKPTKTSSELNSESQKKLIPLEKAIIESITNAGIFTDFNKVKKLYDNLLVVGGGLGKIPAFDFLLTDRINIWRPKFLSSTAMEEILEFVSNERLINENKKKELITEYKQRKAASMEPSKSEIGETSTKVGAIKVEKSEDTTETGEEEATGAINLDDIELDQDELDEIEKLTAFELDLDYIDSISDKGTLLPVNVLPPPREFDPEVLTWKGGSVYARLKVIGEMWVTQNDWDLLESRCLYYKSLFNY